MTLQIIHIVVMIFISKVALLLIKRYSLYNFRALGTGVLVVMLIIAIVCLLTLVNRQLFDLVLTIIVLAILGLGVVVVAHLVFLYYNALLLRLLRYMGLLLLLVAD